MTRHAVILVLLVVPLSAQSVKHAAEGRSLGTGKNKSRPPAALVQYVNPTGLAANPRFTHLVEITGGQTILISGQVAYDRDGNLVGRSDIRAQATQVFENLKIALNTVGASLNDVVKLNTYMVDMPGNFPGYVEVRRQYLASNDHPPASTTVGVASLVNPDLLLEVEAIVVVPENRPR